MDAIASAAACFCGQGMVTEPAARMLLYQTLLPCTPQGEVLRRAIMSHELRSIAENSRRCLFGADSSDAKAAPDPPADADAAAGEPEEGGCRNELFHAVWSGDELLTMAREVSVRRSGAQVEVCGNATSDSDFGRILIFLHDCIDDVLPACTVWRCLCVHVACGVQCA
jgi:hypothetical protein